MRWWYWAGAAAAGAVLIAGAVVIPKELLYSQTAERLGIKNTPDTPQIKARLQWLSWRNAEVLRILREKWPAFRTTSGYRNAQLNAAVDGSPTSRHARGLAFDVGIAGESDYREHVRYLQSQQHRLAVLPKTVIAETASPHIHVEYWGDDDKASDTTRHSWLYERPGRKTGESRSAYLVAV